MDLSGTRGRGGSGGAAARASHNTPFVDDIIDRFRTLGPADFARISKTARPLLRIAAAAEGDAALPAAQKLLIAVLAGFTRAAPSPAFAAACKAEVAGLHPAVLAPFLLRDSRLAVLLTRVGKRSPDGTVEHCAQGFGGRGSTSLTMGALKAAGHAGGVCFTTYNHGLGYRIPRATVSNGGLLDWTDPVRAADRDCSLALFGVLLALGGARGNGIEYLASADGLRSKTALALPVLCAEAEGALSRCAFLQRTSRGTLVRTSSGSISIARRFYHPSGAGIAGDGLGRASMPLQVLADLGSVCSSLGGGGGSGSGGAGAGADAGAEVAGDATAHGAALPPLLLRMLHATHHSLAQQLAALGGAGGAMSDAPSAPPSQAVQKREVLLRFVRNALSSEAAALVVRGDIAGADAAVSRGAVMLLLEDAPNAAEAARLALKAGNTFAQPPSTRDVAVMEIAGFAATRVPCSSLDEFCERTDALMGEPRVPARPPPRTLEEQFAAVEAEMRRKGKGIVWRSEGAVYFFDFELKGEYDEKLRVRVERTYAGSTTLEHGDAEEALIHRMGTRKWEVPKTDSTDSLVWHYRYLEGLCKTGVIKKDDVAVTVHELAIRVDSGVLAVYGGAYGVVRAMEGCVIGKHWSSRSLLNVLSTTVTLHDGFDSVTGAAAGEGKRGVRQPLHPP